MKTTITTLLLFISFTCFAQEQEYQLITLDGKEAYMSTKTGEIRYDNPNSSTKKVIIENKVNTSTISSTNESQTHTIEKGETLYALSKKYGISISDLCDLNNFNQNTVLSIGQQIKVQKTDANNKSITVVDQQNSTSEIDTNNIHIVEKGETLYSISKKYNLSVSDLKQLNNLNSNHLAILQQLKIK